MATAKPTPITGGMRFNRLVVVEEVEHRVLPSGQRHRQFKVVCDCTKEKIVLGTNLVRGLTQSCGCKGRENSIAAKLKHGDAPYRRPRTSEYQTWGSMIKRCENDKHPHFKNYGGRGIKVCERWRNSYVDFLKDMGRKPTPKHSIDRYPDNDGNYEKDNCRWATRDQQALNKRPRKSSRDRESAPEQSA